MWIHTRSPSPGWYRLISRKLKVTRGSSLRSVKTRGTDPPRCVLHTKPVQERTCQGLRLTTTNYNYSYNYNRVRTMFLFLMPSDNVQGECPSQKQMAEETLKQPKINDDQLNNLP
ncbi:unnamed protein product [Laminaria digitata]